MIERVIAASIRHRGIVLLLGMLLSAAGAWAAWSTPIDAIPDLSETQILVYATWPGHAPEEIDVHVTQPISIALQGIEDVRTIRASSEFGYSLLHLIFEDHVELKAARSAVGERLASGALELPPHVTPSLAPDAPATGQIYWYTVEGNGYDLGQLREIQDTLLKHQLANVRGVAEVATVGGFPTEFEIQVDPLRLAACGLSLEDILREIREATQPLSAEAAQGPNAELLVRTSMLGGSSGDDANASTAAIEDLLALSIKSAATTPVRLADVAEVRWSPGPRRGALEKDGNEVVGGVVMMSHGHNPLEVTQRIERKIIELAPSLPSGVRVVPGYDRKRLIQGAIGTVSGTLAEAMITATLCVLIVLLHFRSSLVISLTLPLSVLSAFLGMSLLRWLGILDLQTNIMSLAGMAISIGVLVDSSIVMVENVMHRLRERFGDDPVRGDIRDTVTIACQQVGRPLFFSVLIMLVSFLPVFALSGMEGKMFWPLAVTKSLALAAAALLAISFVPALCSWLIRGRLRGERASWLVRGLMDVYRPTLAFFLERPAGLIWFTAAVGLIGVGPLRSRVLLLTLLAASMLMVLRFAHQRRWGILLAGSLAVCALYSERYLPPLESEFVSPLDEGTVMDMPITVPRASMAQSVDDLKARDMLLCRIPEVEMVMGKAGRAETAADPAPVDMIETMVSFLPPQEWPRRHLEPAQSEHWARAICDGLTRHGVMSLEPAEHQALVTATAPEVHRRIDMALREHAYQGRRELVRQLRQQLPLEAARAMVAGLRREGRLAGSEDDVIAIALAETVDPQLRTILAESPSSIAAAELHQLFLAELTRRKRIKAVPHARSHAVTLEQRLAQARQKIVASHRRTLDQELLTRARETLGRVAMEEVLAHGPPPNDDELRREFGRLRAFRLAPPQPQRSGHHGLANYEPAAFDPLPRFDALHAEFTRPIASDLSLRRKRREELVGFDGELDRAVPMPGWTNVWTMPIQNRVDMLATGVNTTVGIRVLGTQLDDVVATSQAIAETLRDVPGAVDVIADPIRGKGYLDIRVNAQAAERARLPRSVVHHAIEASMGGTVAATIVMHRQRVPIRVTLAMGDRSDPDNILHVPVAAAGFVSMADHEDTVPTWVTLGDVADVKLAEGPATIKSEKGLLRNYVRFNIRGREVLSMVAEAQQRVAERVPLPEGVFLEWTGQYEHQARARRTLWIVAPLVLLSIFGILWATYRDLMDALLIVPAVLGALAGGLVAQVLLGDRLSITVAIGYVACFGMAASTGIIMLVYLREAVERAGGLSALTLDQLRQAVLDGATQRLRPKILTEATTILGLAPMLWATGTGSEVIRPMTAPVLGGILIADEVIDLLVPVLFYAVRKYRWQRLRKPATTS